MSLTSVLHTGDIGGKPVRFYRSPRQGAHFPWHAADDLFLALSFPRPVRKEFQRRLKSDHADDVRTVATPEGIVTIAPHYMAQGAIGAAVEIGCAPASVEARYGVEGVKALNLILAERGIIGAAGIQFAIDAARRA